MVNNGFFSTVHSCASETWERGVQVTKRYEEVRKGTVAYAATQLSPAGTALFSRISMSVSEVFVALSALSGILILPAGIVFCIKRLAPFYGLAAEAVRSGSSRESLKAKWDEVKQIYKSSLLEKIAPALLVAFSVDALFCAAVGLLTLNPALLLRAGGLSIPAAFYIYNALIKDIAASSVEQCTQVVQPVPVPQLRELAYKASTASKPV